MKNLITKGDIVLLAIFLTAAGLIAAYPQLRTAASPSAGQSSADLLVEICVDGELFGSWSLSEEQTIIISNNYGTNRIVIANEMVTMTESDCSNQVCVNTGSIRTQGQMIVCLPHRLSIEIISSDDSEEQLDAISR